VDNQYKFNITNLPVTTRRPDGKINKSDARYLKHIRANINSWNDIFPERYGTNDKLIKIVKFRPIFVMETDNEFFMKVNVMLAYNNKPMYLALTYHGKLFKSGDFEEPDVYVIQLLTIQPIKKDEFESLVRELDEKYGCPGTPFMTMEQQMAYVNKVNEMHMYDS
jgi:hypothetical protein